MLVVSWWLRREGFSVWRGMVAVTMSERMILLLADAVVVIEVMTKGMMEGSKRVAFVFMAC